MVEVCLIIKKIVVDSVLDLYARETYVLPSNAGFELELKTPSFF
jgi:hypothetical protein